MPATMERPRTATPAAVPLKDALTVLQQSAEQEYRDLVYLLAENPDAPVDPQQVADVLTRARRSDADFQRHAQNARDRITAIGDLARAAELREQGSAFAMEARECLQTAERLRAEFNKSMEANERRRSDANGNMTRKLSESNRLAASADKILRATAASGGTFDRINAADHQHQGLLDRRVNLREEIRRRESKSPEAALATVEYELQTIDRESVRWRDASNQAAPLRRAVAELTSLRDELASVETQLAAAASNLERERATGPAWRDMRFD